MSGEHSILAPSDAERWARCPGALHLSKGVPGLDAEYNASGSCSHWILEQCLKNTIAPDHWLGKTLEFGVNPKTQKPFEFEIDQDRCDRIYAVIQQILREPGQMWVEKELNTSPIFGRPNQIGHADVVKLDLLGSCVINEAAMTGVLSVHDFKDGYIRVNARDNLQGLCYLAAALYEFDMLGDINALRFCIHQPKIGHYDEWSYTRKEIEAFVAAIAPTAQLAYDLYHGAVEFDPARHLLAGDSQCYWCPVRGSCPARAKRIVDLFAAVITGHEIDDAALSKIYLQLDEIEQACRDYRAEALRRALGGRTIEGHKLVRGRRGPRKWEDLSKAEQALQLLLPEDKVYQPREVISPTEAEKLLKKDYASVARYVTQSDGSLSLAPVDDERPEIEVPKFEPPTED
jgi:hypothetical protein